MDSTNPTAQKPIGVSSLPAEQAGAGAMPPAASVSSSQKEQQPFGSPTTESMIQPSETEPKIHEELQRLGVEATKEQPSLTEEHAAIGIKTAAESTPVTTQPLGIVRLPIQGEEAKRISKSHGIKDSLRWLATLILRQFKIMKMKEA